MQEVHPFAQVTHSDWDKEGWLNLSEGIKATESQKG